MEVSEAAQLIGSALGASAAVAGAVWGALVRPLQARVKQMETGAGGETALLRQELGQLKTAFERLEKQQDRLSERVSRAVTDEEFGAYTQATTQSVNSLTEKLGVATGAIESWYRLHPPPG